jgi:hypothetical protein
MSIKRISDTTIDNNKILEYSTKWIRPSDWVEMPAIDTSTTFAYLVHPVFENGTFVALGAATTSGQYTVDWGDGTTNDVNSLSNISKSYDYASLSNPVTDKGYKTVLIKVTPKTAGQNLTNLYLNQTHTNIKSTHTQWLDIALNFTTTGNIQFSQSDKQATWLERFRIWNGRVNATAGFYNCRNLQSISPVLNVATVSGSITNLFYGCSKLEYSPGIIADAAVNNTSSLFFQCYALKYITPFATSAAGVNAGSMFRDCAVLETIPNLNMKLTSASGMFNGCTKLQRIDTKFDLSACTTITSMFYGCSLLTNVNNIGLDTVTTTCTTTNFMFYNCRNLVTTPLFTTSAVINAQQMFFGCQSLMSVPEYNFASATQADSMFQWCYSLRSMPDFNFSNATGTNGVNNMFNDCRSLNQINNVRFPATYDYSASTPFPVSGMLSKFRMTTLPRSFSVSTNLLSKAELEIIFGNLGIGYSNQSLTISNNYGSPTPVSKTLCGLTVKSVTITQGNTSSLVVGMVASGTGTPVQTNTSFTTNATASTFTLAGHNIPNDTPISVIAQTTTTGLTLRRIHYVVNATTDTIQISQTIGGSPVTFTNNGSCTMRWLSVITAITNNVSITMSAPMATTGTQTLTFQELQIGTALLKGWSVTQ